MGEHKRLVRFFAGLVLYGVSSSMAQAMLMTYDFTGTVSIANYGVLFPSKSVGDTFGGSFVLDTNASSFVDVPGFAAYSSTNMELTLDGATYAIDSIAVWSDHTTISEGFEFKFSVPSSVFDTGFLSFRSSADIYADSSIPTSFNLSDFDALSRVSLREQFSIPPAYDTGAITRVSAVPEPASLALMGLGLVGMGFVRRKKAA